MKYTNVLAALLLVLLIAPVGCIAAAEEESEAFEPGVDALVINNALSSNALSSNALSSNALSSNALSSNALAAIQAPDVAGDVSRSLLRYIVSCALDSSASFSFPWMDSTGTVHHEIYPGGLGLAPGWADGPLDEAGQRMVSACLAARTNWYGVSVVISMRSPQEPLRTLTTGDEREEFDQLEGAFWGNVFSATPYLNACHDASNLANSRAAQRECATGHVDAAGKTQACGMIALLGNCKHICKKRNGSGRKYYSECTDPDLGDTAYVVTTALR